MPAYQSLRSQNVACVHKRACNRTTESACGEMELPEGPDASGKLMAPGLKKKKNSFLWKFSMEKMTSNAESIQTKMLLG